MRRSCFLTSGMLLLMALGAGCSSGRKGLFFEGTLDADALVAEAGPGILELNEFRSDARAIVAVKQPAQPMDYSYDPKVFLLQLRSGLAKQANGKVTFVAHSEDPRLVRRTLSNKKEVVDIEKLAETVSQELLTMAELPDREIVLSVLLPRDDDYVNVDADEYLKILHGKLTAAKREKIRFLPPGEYEGADYILTSIFTKKNETVDSPRLLERYFKNRKAAAASKKHDDGMERAARGPRFLRRSTIATARYGSPAKEVDSKIAAGIDLVVIDTKNRTLIFDRQLELDGVTATVSKVDYVLTTTVSNEILYEGDKTYYPVSLRLVTPDEKEKVIWEAEYRTQFIVL